MERVRLELEMTGFYFCVQTLDYAAPKLSCSFKKSFIELRLKIVDAKSVSVAVKTQIQVHLVLCFYLLSEKGVVKSRA